MTEGKWPDSVMATFPSLNPPSKANDFGLFDFITVSYETAGLATFADEVYLDNGDVSPLSSETNFWNAVGVKVRQTNGNTEDNKYFRGTTISSAISRPKRIKDTILKDSMNSSILISQKLLEIEHFLWISNGVVLLIIPKNSLETL